MRRAGKFGIALVAAIAMVAVFVLPAGAASGNGSVSGTVSSSPGIPPVGQPAHIDSFHFTPIVLTGQFADNNNNTFQGEITTSDVFGRNTTKEDVTQGNGVVDAFTFHDTLTLGTKLNGTCGTANLPGSAGTFMRVGTIVEVALHCSYQVGTAPKANTTVTVVAQFTPTSGDGITTPVTAANFTGEYVVM